MSGLPQTVFLPNSARAAMHSTRDVDESLSVSRVAGLLLPSFGVAIFMVTLFNVLFLSGGTRTLFRDADTGWHVRTGEAIIQSGAVPVADSYSLVHAGREWFAWEWLADAALGSAFLSAGPAGVALLTALLIATVGWGVWRLAVSLGANLFLSLAILVPALGATTIHWLARPHIFSWLLGLCFIAVAERHRRGQALSRSLWILPAIACLWANIHGSFLLGIAILVAYGLGEWLRGDAGAVSGRRFAVAALISLLATFANPYGLRMHQHVFEYLRDGYLMDHISEFRSFNFHAPGAIYVELFLALAALGTVYLFRQKSYAPALLSLALMHMSLYSARHLPMYAVLMSPIFAAAISAEWSSLPPLQKFVRYSDRLLAMEKQVMGAFPAALCMVVALIALQAQARADAVGFDSRKFPVAAGNYLADKSPSMRRVFARDYWGGYLIYRFNGEMKVFVDGRSDFYRPDWLETYAQINEVKPGWNHLLDAFQIDTVLVPPDHPLASALRLKPEWKVSYADSVAAIFERASQ